jgi:uncharacterized lipoprotein
MKKSLKLILANLVVILLASCNANHLNDIRPILNEALLR